MTSIFFQVQQLLDCHDLDKDGKVDFNEFILMHDQQADSAKQCMLNQTEVKKLALDQPTLEEMYHLFQTADKDGSGSLSSDELALIFKKLRGRQPSPVELQYVFSSADVDNNGVVDFLECCTMFKAWITHLDRRPSSKVQVLPMDGYTI